MSQIRFLQFSDVHLGRTFSYLSAEKNTIRQQDFKSVLKRMIDLALENEVHALLVPGDLFDAKIPPFALIEYVRQEFERFTESGGFVFMAPGNHDAWLLDSLPASRILSEMSNVHIFNQPQQRVHSCPIGDETVHVYGFAFQPDDPFQPALREFTKLLEDGLHVALIHGSYNPGNNKGIVESELYQPVTEADFDQVGFDYVALGHYHKLMKCESKQPAYYAGSPEGLRLNQRESGDRHCLLITIDAGQVDAQPLVTNEKQIQILEYDLALEDSATVQQKLRQLANDKLLLSVKLHGVVQSMDDLVKVAGIQAQFEDVFFHIQVDTEQIICADTLFADLPGQTPEGLYIQVIQDQIEKAPDEETKSLWYQALLAGLRELKLAG